MKSLYGEISLNQTELLGSNIDKMKLEYYKMDNKSNILKEEETTYGVEIVKREYVGNEEKVEAKKALLCDNEKEIDDIIEILKSNKVTPIELEDIVNDYLYQKQNNIYEA